MFAALSCAATMVIQIPIATGYLNFGDGLCLLAGWILVVRLRGGRPQ